VSADNLHPYFAPQTLVKLQGLQLRAQRIVEGYVAGLHRSPMHGHSIEFAEHREYVPGDDLRSVDWKVFARTDKYYVKQYEDETNLICYLVVDISASMQYRGPHSSLSKSEYAQCLAAALAWLVLQQQDAISLVTFDDQIRVNLPPSNIAPYLKHVIQVLDSSESAAATRAGAVLHELAGTFTKRGVVILISDLFDKLDSLVTGLRHLRHQRHDLVVLQVLDDAELDFPFRRPVLFRGLEQASTRVADPASLRRTYLAELSKHIDAIQHACRESEIDYRLARTNQPFDVTLTSLLTSRMSRVRR
jgi:uncharacterized protein (DUF58 family)